MLRSRRAARWHRCTATPFVIVGGDASRRDGLASLLDAHPSVTMSARGCAGRCGDGGVRAVGVAVDAPDERMLAQVRGGHGLAIVALEPHADLATVPHHVLNPHDGVATVLGWLGLPRIALQERDAVIIDLRSRAVVSR